MKTRIILFVFFCLSSFSIQAQNPIQPTHNAEFIGGQDSLVSYLINSINYPIPAIVQKIEGHVIVQFVIDKDGSIIDVRVIKGVHPLLDEEAIRVIKSMPKWKPAMKDGVLVKSRFNMPINFKLPADDNKY